jgi:hypothetical protein
VRLRRWPAAMSAYRSWCSPVVGAAVVGGPVAGPGPVQPGACGVHLGGRGALNGFVFTGGQELLVEFGCDHVDEPGPVRKRKRKRKQGVVGQVEVDEPHLVFWEEHRVLGLRVAMRPSAGVQVV